MKQLKEYSSSHLGKGFLCQLLYKIYSLYKISFDIFEVC